MQRSAITKLKVVVLKNIVQSAQTDATPSTDLDQDALEQLKGSLRAAGQLSAILRCKQHPSRVLAGHHRAAAGGKDFIYHDVDEFAKRIGKTHAVAEKLVGIASNVQRKVSEEEREKEFMALAELLIKQGTLRNKTAAEVVRLTGFSKEYVYSHLPPDYRDTARGRAIRSGLARGKVNSVDLGLSNSSDDHERSGKASVQDGLDAEMVRFSDSMVKMVNDKLDKIQEVVDRAIAKRSETEESAVSYETEAGRVHLQITGTVARVEVSPMVRSSMHSFRKRMLTMAKRQGVSVSS